MQKLIDFLNNGASLSKLNQVLNSSEYVVMLDDIYKGVVTNTYQIKGIVYQSQDQHVIYCVPLNGFLNIKITDKHTMQNMRIYKKLDIKNVLAY